MNRELPARPSLEYLRKEAKRLLDAARSGDASSRERLAVVTTSGRCSLHHAQLALAREYGFSSWRDLAARVRTTETDGFLAAVTRDSWDRVQKLVAPPEHVRKGNIWVAAACGDIDAISHLIKKDKALVSAKGGPLKASPLIYVCFSRLNHGREEEFTACALMLLLNGADASDAYLSDGYPNDPFSALYGAAAVVHNGALVSLLLANGANVNDNESLYHACESRDHTCLKLLLAAGPMIDGTNALYRMLDYSDVVGLTLLLDAGADINEPGKEGALNHAIRRGRTREHIELLLDRGADSSRSSLEGFSPYQLALRNSNLAAAQVLAERGHGEPLPPSQALLLACLNLDIDSARAIGIKPTDLDPHDLDAFIEAAWNGELEVVRTMLDLGFPVGHTSTKTGHTALHCACWKGQAEMAKVLLDAGAPTDIVEREFNALPIGWACHGSQFARDGDGHPLNPRADYPTLVRMLVDAGSPVPPDLGGSEDVRAVFAIE